MKSFNELLQNGVTDDSLALINAKIDELGLPLSKAFFSMKNALLTNDTILTVSNYVSGELSQILKDFIQKTYRNLGITKRNQMHNSFNPVINAQQTKRYGHEDYDNATNF